MFAVPSRPLQAVTFDLDGLMFNTEELYQEVGEQLLARRQRELSDELIDRMMGRKSAEALQLMIDWHRLDATTEELEQESAAIFLEMLPSRLAPMPGLVELLAALEQARVPKGIATSSGREFVRTVLEKFAWEPRFDFVLASENVRHGKPAPEIYHLAAERHGVAPQQMMVLEDTPVGCRAAVAADSYAVAVPAGRTLGQQFPPVAFHASSLADPRIYAALGLDPPSDRQTA